MSKFKEALVFLVISFLILFLNAFPDYYAYSVTPPGMVFSGQASWFDPWDINVYVSAIRSGQARGFLLPNLYTTEPNRPVLYYPLYTLSGMAFKAAPPFLLFHLLAVSFGFMLCLTVFYLAKIFIKEGINRFLAVPLTLLGGGLGWIFFPNTPSADLFMTGFTYLSHFQRAHEALAVVFYLLSLGSFYLYIKRRTNIFGLLSLLSLLLLLVFYPFYLLSYALICGIYSLVVYLRNGAVKPLTLTALNTLLGGLFVIFYWHHLSSNSTFGGVLAQQLSGPNLSQLVLGYGLVAPLVIYALFKIKKDDGLIFLTVWLLSGLLLSFLPLGFARFYLRTLFFPAVVISLAALKAISSRMRIPSKLLLGLFCLLTLASSIFITYRRIEEVKNSNPWFYVSADEEKVFEVLQKQNSPGGVLAAYTLGNMIPAATGKDVYFGHLIQTPQASEKYRFLVRFYSNGLSDDEAKSFLLGERISYIFWGREEQEITKRSSRTDKLKYSFLKPAFGRSDTLVFSY